MFSNIAQVLSFFFSYYIECFSFLICSYLWYFVSKFTEFDAKKLHRMYRKASKKHTSGDEDVEGEPGTKSKSESRSKKKDKSRVKAEVRELPIFANQVYLFI